MQVRGTQLDRGTRSTRLLRLSPDTRYLICVAALGDWPSPSPSINSSSLSGTLAALSDSTSTRCTEVRTLAEPEPGTGSVGGGSVLTRRLGLIVGSCMGCVVFVALVSVLGYLKLKKQRTQAKREPPLPQEYISYRHFSIQSSELPGTCIGIGNTSLNS